MARRVIINADDFGLSAGVNRGIVSAFDGGVLSSTTLLVNLDHFDQAVALARENPGLGVGIHLSLLWGRPVSNPAEVPALVDRDGRFPRSLTTLARRYFLRRLSMEQVRAEFRRQIEKFLATGLVPTHLDTHKHIHCLRGIMDALMTVAGEFGIEKVRWPSEVDPVRNAADGRGPVVRPSWKTRGKRALIRRLCGNGRRDLRAAGMKTTDHFAGIAAMERLDSEVLDRMLRDLESGVTEIMCHPGYADAEAAEYSRTPPHREIELEALKAPRIKERIVSEGIRVIDYRQL